jgi:uracil-DNA glycosylase
MNKEQALVELQAEMKACRLCLEAGYEITPGAVFRGGPSARLMLIGQAPGTTEVVAKRPFNAGSGRRLFQWLGEAGWDEEEFRARHYMTAVTKCYPGRSPTGKGDRVPGKAEQALCRPFLEREIALINPRVILLIGGLAIRLFYPSSARLEDLVGTAAYFPPETVINPLNFDLSQAERLTAFDPAKDECGRWVVPLPHPSGASLWPNKAENRLLISRAMRLLADIRLAFAL